MRGTPGVQRGSPQRGFIDRKVQTGAVVNQIVPHQAASRYDFCLIGGAIELAFDRTPGPEYNAPCSPPVTPERYPVVGKDHR